ncbi:alpha-glucuronidase [Microbacterium sp. ET2]|uniref:alpha-glucuronidase n=1 Tax=Microbacterium albipurpureum TaxID=3050384 RepID=UPI00259C8FDA|nr:alpha-glucuronidase [Microbacterium sp. ET2 (Ac-2212)]WJL96847.1 alpha-glucuronidase [Microbacterium sp. ET2 (Ac-2212)]
MTTSASHFEAVADGHPMWLPAAVAGELRGRTATILGEGVVIDTLRAEIARAGMTEVSADADLVIAPSGTVEDAPDGLGPEAFFHRVRGGRTVITYGGPNGGLYGWFHHLRHLACGSGEAAATHEPLHELRMLDHWDNVAVHPHMGQVERGYAGGSIFYDDGRLREDLSRVHAYARLLASVGINRVTINNVNVGRREARLLTDDLGTVERLAAIFRPWGIRTHLSINFASPLALGELDTSDPLEPAVQKWWTDAAARVFTRIPDFGGFLVKADSEGQPGPYAYGRDHADGANMLARAVAPFDGLVHWRAFVYNHHQDWRDRTTDRARAAYDTFVPLDGRFDDNVILQVKYGPLDFQVREPISPVIPGMTRTRVALELQVTQEYTGQQQHAVYLGPQWSEILAFEPTGDGTTLAETVRGGIAAVSNVGSDDFWTGHPLAQANLYAYGRLAWDPTLDPGMILDEWIALTFGADDRMRRSIRSILDDSWRTYEMYTAPLGVCFMVSPLNRHYGPDVDGYEYSAWGTYHFADRDGVGVDRTVETGTGFAGQYSEPWASRYESLDTVPDELVLFFHHVPYTHRLHSGATVIQHIYDTHFAGVERVEEMAVMWEELEDRVPSDLHRRVRDRFTEQRRSAIEWRDQINTYFWRKSGIADEVGRTIY